MDSMKTLDTSLPRSSPRRRTRQQTGEILSAFKAAALSVTQLYKTAVADEESNRSARLSGYQEALEDLQDFLDEQNLGLNDGEGWRVREWAAQKTAAIVTDLEDPNEPEESKRARSSSPALQNRSKQDNTSSSRISPEDSTRSESMPPTAPTTVSASTQTTSQSPRPEIFHFKSNITPPQLQDIDMDVLDGTITPVHTSANNNFNPSAPIRLEVVQKTPRSSSNRHTNHNRERQSNTTGLKRKASLIDFFDISGVNSKDNGGGKRGRLG